MATSCRMSKCRRLHYPPSVALKLMNVIFTSEELVNGNLSGKTNSKDEARQSTIVPLNDKKTFQWSSHLYIACFKSCFYATIGMVEQYPPPWNPSFALYPTPKATSPPSSCGHLYYGEDGGFRGRHGHPFNAHSSPFQLLISHTWSFIDQYHYWPLLVHLHTIIRIYPNVHLHLSSVNHSLETATHTHGWSVALTLQY